ncbi:hypothetical protein V5O48_013775 [Marasmius crinis-equi]|uniref:O-methyltransferase C-terminal domain-containing protein n=1 Tax=Marasmius crinis-equi TaxID=585013 RepID=A0ABR3EZ54_9AGAR
MSLDNSHLTVLTDLINSAVQDVIAEYASVGKTVSALDSLEPGPFYVPEETPAKLSRAVQIIEAASLEHEEPVCLLVVTESRIADLSLDKPNDIHAEDLAKFSSLDAGKLGRILRVPATKHRFRKDKPDVFANNRFSFKSLSTDATSLLTDESLLVSTHLNETMTKPSEKNNGIRSQRATGHAFFDYYKLVRKKQGERFLRAMVGWGDVTGKGLMAKEALQNQRVEFVPFDFLKDAAAGGGDFYYIRSILRDWPDAESLIILRNVRKAMKPSSKLIIHDTALRNSVRDPSSSSPLEAELDGDYAPEPLLPNWGAARARTLPQFVELCKQCDLKFHKLYPVGETDLVEFVPV